MKIGVFDSGLGGLVITRAFIEKLGRYDLLYYGDTKNLPYGDKKPSEILMLTIRGVEHLIKSDCKLIIIACNTASASALRYIQQIYIPEYHPDIKVLGVVVPAVEEAIASSKKKIGVVATNSTINSHIYDIEIKKINPAIKVKELATPELVPAVEKGDFVAAERFVEQYTASLTDIDSLILGCTHYPLLKDLFRKHLNQNIHIISQDEFMGEKLASYIHRHPEIDKALSKNSHHEFTVSKLNTHYKEVANKIMPGVEIKEI